MDKQRCIRFSSWVLILALMISFIPVLPGTITYAETTPTFTTAADTIPDFLLPVTSQTVVPEGYVGIYTKEDLDNVRNDLTQNYILMNDIVFTEDDFLAGGDYYNNGAGWIPMGVSGLNLGYAGIFDGNGYAVKNLKCVTTDLQGGLFLGIRYDGMIKNLALLNCDITSTVSAAGIGSGFGTFENCTVSGKISAQNANGVASGAKRITYCMNQAEVTSMLDNAYGVSASGICPYPNYISYCVNLGKVSAIDQTQEGSITYAKAGGITIKPVYVMSRCINYGTVYASSYNNTNSVIWAYAGGVAAEYSSAYQCNNFGSITAVSSYNAFAGGVLGKGYARQSYNCGPIYAHSLHDASFAGGIVGVNAGSGTVDCFNTGIIEATTDDTTYWQSPTGSGGIAGLAEADVTNCYNTGLAYSSRADGAGGIIGTSSSAGALKCYTLENPDHNQLGTSVTDAQLSLPSTYVGFDFSTIWKMDPMLQRPVIIENEPEVFGIHYFIDGEEYSEITPSAYMLGASNWLPEVIATGYYVDGWYTDGSLTGIPETEIPYGTYGEYTCYGKWSPNTYNIKFNANGGTGTMSSLAMTYDSAKALTTNAYKKTGYSFLGWAKTSTGTVAYKDKVSVKNLTSTNKATVNLYAKWGAPILSAKSNSYNSIKVSWAAAGSATSYKIYRATSATGTYALVHTSLSTTRSWIDSGRVTGKTYYYKVYPVAGGKTYKFSTYKSAKAVPTTPTMTVSKASTTSIKIAWNNVSGATGYQIYRATSATGTYSLLKTTSSTSYTNAGLTAGQTYYYKVRGYHMEGATKVYGSFSTVKYLKF